MIYGPFKPRILPILIIALFCSCSGNVIQTTVFSDGFQELETGSRPYFDDSDPAIYFHPDRGIIGDWYVATSHRQSGFGKAWEIREEGGKKYLAQTFNNLDSQNEPLSLITHPMLVAGDSLWSDHTIEVEFTPMAKFDKCGVVFKYQHPSDFYFFGIEGNTVILKHIQPPVTPLRPIEEILDYRPLVWTPGDRFSATVTVRRNSITAILNDSINMYLEPKVHRPGRIGLISDLPARFHRVEVKVLKGEQRKLNRRKRQIARRETLELSDHPDMIRWKKFDNEGIGPDQNIRLGDLTGDGNKEILIVRGSSASSSSVDYVGVLNLDGEWLWQYGTPASSQQEEGDELAVQVHDLNGDGTREVIFFSGGSLLILEGKTGTLMRRMKLPSDMEVRSLIFGDLLGTGRRNCLVLSDRSHRLLVLNEQLDVLWEREVQKGSLPLVYDLDRDGQQEVLMGYSVFNPEGELKFDVGAFIGDRCNGIAVHELYVADRIIPCLMYAAGDWGLLYFDFNGNLLKQNIMGHVKYITVANLDSEQTGIEVATSNGWGSDGMVHLLNAAGNVYKYIMPVAGAGRCLPVNWKGDGEEFYILSADSLNGGLFDGAGSLAVQFPSDGHPVNCYLAQDLTGDTRDEILVWNKQEIWIYTQDDNPRMGNTYAPDRLPLFNHSMYQMNHSFPGW